MKSYHFSTLLPPPGSSSLAHRGQFNYSKRRDEKQDQKKKKKKNNKQTKTKVKCVCLHLESYRPAAEAESVVVRW
jgi:hypothetical protein